MEALFVALQLLDFLLLTLNVSLELADVGALCILRLVTPLQVKLKTVDVFEPAVPVPLQVLLLVSYCCNDLEVVAVLSVKIRALLLEREDVTLLACNLVLNQLLFVDLQLDIALKLHDLFLQLADLDNLAVQLHLLMQVLLLLFEECILPLFELGVLLDFTVSDHIHFVLFQDLVVFL